MLSIGKVVDPDYYLDRVAERLEAYYSLRKEAPGRWLGQDAAVLGLSGLVDGTDLKMVLEGRDPRTGESLGLGSNRKVRAFDLYFRAPKSVSVLAGVGFSDTVKTIHECHERAVDAAVSYLEREATWTRRGRDGVETMRGRGVVAAAFRHRTSRALDPHLHTHVLVANMTPGPDGRWTTLDAGLLYHHAKTASYLYEAHLRHELTRELGLEWGPVHNGIADVRGVPKTVLQVFSKRRAEIETRLEERGLSSARAAEIATLDTRRGQSHDVEGADLRTRWRAEAAAHGLGVVEYGATLHRVTEVPLTAGREADLAVNLSSAEGLTHQQSSFDRRDVLRALCERLPEGVEVAGVEEMAARYLQRREVVDLRDPSRSTSRRLDGKSVVVDTGGTRYSTRDMLAVERALIAGALARHAEGCGIANSGALSAALAARPSLSAEQARLVVEVTTSGNGVDVIAAAAGTGKTFSLDAARDAWGRSGYRVIGCALAARAAVELEAGAGIPSWTLARLLGQLNDGDMSSLDARTVVVCDETAMVGSRTLARLLSQAGAARAKVVLVGDARQLPEIEAGGGFAALGRRLGPLTLRENRRQREAWERDALARLRAGKVADALDLYQAHRRVVTGTTAEQARETMVADWWAARSAGDSVVMLAARRADVDDLNARARIRMQLAGHLSGPELLVDDRPYQAGDRVMCLRNQYRLGLCNGMIGTVRFVDPEARSLEISTKWGETAVAPRSYIDASHITYAYATTVTKVTQTVFGRQWGALGFAIRIRWGGGWRWLIGWLRWVEGDAQVDVDVPAAHVNGFEKDAHQALALFEVELVDGLGDSSGEVAEAFAQSVGVGELVALADQLVAVVGEVALAVIDFAGTLGKFVGSDDAGLVEVGQPAAFAVDGLEASVEAGQLDVEEFVVGCGLAGADGLMAGKEEVGCEHGLFDLFEDEGVESFGADVAFVTAGFGVGDAHPVPTGVVADAFGLAG